MPPARTNDAGTEQERKRVVAIPKDVEQLLEKKREQIAVSNREQHGISVTPTLADVAVAAIRDALKA